MFPLSDSSDELQHSAYEWDEEPQRQDAACSPIRQLETANLATDSVTMATDSVTMATSTDSATKEAEQLSEAEPGQVLANVSRVTTSHDSGY